MIGYLVGKHWKLPDFICDAIRYHHDMTRVENHAVRGEVLDELGLSEETLPEVLDVILERYHGKG